MDLRPSAAQDDPCLAPVDLALHPRACNCGTNASTTSPSATRRLTHVAADLAFGHLRAVLGDQSLPDAPRGVALLARRIAIGHQPRIDHTAIGTELRCRATGERLTGGSGDIRACLTARRCTQWRSASGLIDSLSRPRSCLICSNVCILEPIPSAPIRSSSMSSQWSRPDRTEMGPVQATTPGPLQMSTPRRPPPVVSIRNEVRMQLCQAREEYLRWLVVTRDLSPHTIRAYEGDIAAFEQHLGQRSPVELIDREKLVAFIEEQQSAGLSSMSIRRRASGLRGFCAWLRARRLLDCDPWLGTTVAVGRSRKLPRVLPAHELDRLFQSLRATADVAAIHDVDSSTAPLARPYECTTLLAVALMVATGVRVNEVVSITCHDIDLHGRSVRIVGKGRRERQVFLPNDWITCLTRDYLAMRATLGLDHPHLLFNSRRAPLTTAAMRSRLGKAARDAGLSEKVTPHMLRHTAATQLIEAGVDIRYIQRLLGHASLSTTEIYTHVSDGALRRVVSDADVVGRLLQHR
jgi:site-specific recombinase XerD